MKLRTAVAQRNRIWKDQSAEPLRFRIFICVTLLVVVSSLLFHGEANRSSLHVEVIHSLRVDVLFLIVRPRNLHNIWQVRPPYRVVGAAHQTVISKVDLREGFFVMNQVILQVRSLLQSPAQISSPRLFINLQPGKASAVVYVPMDDAHMRTLCVVDVYVHIPSI